jgi:hypothetical protein
LTIPANIDQYGYATVKTSFRESSAARTVLERVYAPLNIPGVAPENPGVRRVRRWQM